MGSPDYETEPVFEDEGEGRDANVKYDLGEPAADVYRVLGVGTRRENILELSRTMSELTITSVMPPQGYKAGDDLPGNNQSIGAQCVRTLSSKLMFTAFPPGQPMMRLDPIEQKIQKEIDADPELYAHIQLALSRLELAHRKRAATVGLATAYVGLVEVLLVCGNCLWKQSQLTTPAYFKPDCYVVSRDNSGHPVLTIHHEKPRWVTLSKDIRDAISAEHEGDDKDDEAWRKKPDWAKEADIYSVCRLIRSGEGDDPYKDWSWEYWQETAKGTFLPGTEVETDYDDCPMWPAWLIPSLGDDWGLSYCEAYRGDLFTVENLSSALNDGAALAAWALTFVKPGSRTSLKAVKGAKNLAVLSGDAGDVTVFKSEKTADFAWVASHIQKAEQRLGVAFLLQSAARREGERVTAEEVQRVGQELDQAMGGLYTATAQGTQRRIIMRFIRLHEEANEDIPPLPPGVVDVQVVTGVDAMGRSVETQALMDFVTVLSKAFPQQVQAIINPGDFTTRLAAGMSIKPDGLVRTDQEQAATKQQQQQQMAQQELMAKASGPVAGAFAKHAAAKMLPGAQQQQGDGSQDGGQQGQQDQGGQ